MRTIADYDVALAEQIQTFYSDPLGFVKFIYPWGEKGGTLEAYNGPDTWQADLLSELGAEISARAFNGVDAVEPIRFSIASGHGIGKSALTSWLIHFLLSTRPNTRGVITSGSYDQLQGKTFAEAAKWLKLSLNGHWFSYRGTKGNLAMFRTGAQENWNVRGQASTTENADAFAGLHNANSTPFFIFDEASAVPDKIFEVAEGGLTDGEPMIFLFGNPTKSTGAFADTFNKNRHRWKHKQIDSRDSCMTNKELIAQWEEDWGEDSDFFRVRVKGQFPRVGDSQFISSELVEDAQKREVEPTPLEPIVMGVDVARFGDDCSVILIRHGRKIIEIRKFRELDLMALSAMVIESIAVHKPHAIFVDGAGVGGGVIDRLKQLGFHPLEVQAGSKPLNPEQFTNLRAEMWWRMRDWLATADIPARDSELKADLTGIQYGYTDKMQVRMERKKDMKARGQASPDCFIAGTMVHTPQGLRPIETLKEGDEVTTPMGVSRVFRPMVSTSCKLTTVVFSDGTSLTGKGAHKVFTWERGWVAMDALPLYNGIESYSILGALQWKMLNLLFTREKHSTFKHQVDTISQAGKVQKSDFFIGAYGLTTTGLFLQGVVYITRTMIGQTMKFLTSTLCLLGSMLGSTCSSDAPYLGKKNGIKPTSRPPESKRQSGMGQKQGACGIKNMENKHGRGESLPKQPVPYAPLYTKLIFQVRANFAPNRVPRESPMYAIKQLLDYVFCVAQRLRTTSIGLRTVVPVSVQTSTAQVPTKVYNLTLETENVYYANGTLVQNCADSLSLTFAETVNPIARPRPRRNRNVNWRTL